VRVYAESNFVLELVLEQEERDACEQLLELAARKQIELALPAFSVIEPYQTINRRRTDNVPYRQWLDRTQVQVARSASLATDAFILQSAKDLVIRADQVAQDRYREIRARLVSVARLLPIDAAVLAEASSLNAQLALELPDALVLACVLADGTARPTRSVFANRNSKDFLTPDVRSRLKGIDCTAIGVFSHALEHVKSSAASA
jgi:hypothetical protein